MQCIAIAITVAVAIACTRAVPLATPTVHPE